MSGLAGSLDPKRSHLIDAARPLLRCVGLPLSNAEAGLDRSSAFGFVTPKQEQAPAIPWKLSRERYIVRLAAGLFDWNSATEEERAEAAALCEKCGLKRPDQIEPLEDAESAEEPAELFLPPEDICG